MSIRRLCLSLLGAVAFAPGIAGAADDPFSGVPSFLLEPRALLEVTAGAPSDPEAAVEVHWLDLTYRFDAAGKRVHTRRAVYKILTPEGVEDWAQLEQSYLPWYQETPRFAARVVTPDGRSRDLDPKTIADSPAAQEPELLDDERVLRAPLPAVAVGAVVELEVTVIDRQPFFTAGTVTRASLESGAPVKRARVTIESPPSLPVRHRLEGLPGVEPRQEGNATLRRVVVAARDLPGDFGWWAPSLPPEVPRGPAVVFSTGESWSAIAEAYSKIVDQQIATPQLGGFDELQAPVASQQEEIRLLLERVHRDVRYTGVELGDAGLVPRSPGETVERRFGDCKDKAALVVALLRDRGIPAYLALLNTGDAQDVVPQLPGIGLFNHAIVYVPGNPALWIDATDPLSRLGQLPAADQGRLALIAGPTTRDLVKTPVATAADNRTVEVREITLPLLGNGRLVESSELHGEPARELRSAWLDNSDDEIRESLEGYVERAYRAEKLVSHESTGSRDLSRPMTTRLEAEGVGLAVSDPGEAVVVIPLGSLFEGLPLELTIPQDEEAEDGEEAAPRTADYFLPQRFRREWTYRVTVPSNLEPRELPKDEKVALGPAVLEKSFRREPGRVIAHLLFEIDRERLTPAEGEVLRTGLAEVQSVLLWFDQKTALALQAGRVREALDESERLAREFPGQAFPFVERSRALLAAGFGEEAREVAERATEIEPGSGLAFHQLGWARQHDDLGRRLESGGYDRPGAIAAFEKAIELDPDNDVFVAELAIQLEYGADGSRYTTGEKDLGRAIELYQKLEDELDNENLAANLMATLARAGRWQELAERVEKETSTAKAALWKVAAKAALEGADAAIAQAGRHIAEPEERSKALVNAAEETVRRRRYEDASKLYSAASRLGAGAPELLGRAQVFTRAKALDWGRPAPAKTPEEAFWTIFAMFFGPSFEIEGMLPYFTPGLRERPFDDEAAAHLDKLRAEMEKAAASQNLTLEVLADIVRAVAQPTVEPDPSGDFRVTAKFGERDLTVVAVPADGTFLALPADLPTLGHEARWQAERGRLEAARRYLDWALEEAAPTHPKDPLSGSAFALVWQKGREADADRLRLAGAVAVALADADAIDPYAVASLEPLRPLARTPDEQLAVAWALATANLRLSRPAAAVDDTARLLAAHPDSESALALAFQAYAGAGRFDDLAQLGQARLERKPEDPWGLRYLAQAEAYRGHVEEALALLDRLLATGRTLSGDYNLSAWLRVLAGRVDATALDHAQRAVTSETKPGYAALHTLALVYAETDQLNEAYTTLKQAVDAAENGEVNRNDRLVQGRMAEGYGLTDLARELYGLVPEPEPEEGLGSSWHLARRWIERLP